MAKSQQIEENICFIFQVLLFEFAHKKNIFVISQIILLSGFGISSKMWDYPFGTLIPEDENVTKED